MNVKVNDTVLVITGKYKGKQGKVLTTSPEAGNVIVEGVNIVHKHEKARRPTRRAGSSPKRRPSTFPTSKSCATSAARRRESLTQ